MRADDERAVVGQDLVGTEDVGGGTYLAAAEPILRDAEGQEQVLHEADACALRKDRQHMETEGGGELEAGEEEHLVQEPPVLLEPGFLGGLQPLEVLKELEVFDLPPEVGVAAHRVVVGEGDDVEAPCFGPLEDVQRRNVRLLVVGRGRRMEMEVHASPVELCDRLGLPLAPAGFALHPATVAAVRRHPPRRAAATASSESCVGNRTSPFREWGTDAASREVAEYAGFGPDSSTTALEVDNKARRAGGEECATIAATLSPGPAPSP